MLRLGHFDAFPRGTIIDLLLNEGRQHPAGADGVASHARGGRLQRYDLGQTDNAVLRGHVGRLLGAGDKAVGAGDVDDPAPVALQHLRQGRLGGVEGSREIDGDDGVPAVGREILHRRGVLYAGVVDEDVHPAEVPGGLIDHAGDLIRLGHVRARVGGAHAIFIGDGPLQPLDLAGVAEAVEQHVCTGLSELSGDAEADARGRSGDDRDLAFERHLCPPMFSISRGSYAAWGNGNAQLPSSVNPTLSTTW